MQKHLMTQEDYEKIKSRLSQLYADRDKNIVDIQDARGQGDLSENADYKSARERQAEIEKEIAELEDKIKYAEIIDDNINNGNLTKFVTVEYLTGLEPGEDKIYTFQVLTSIGANPLEDKISYESPLGKAILFAKEGEVKNFRTENGDRFEVKVLKIKDSK